MPKSGPLGSVRGARSNACPYRDHWIRRREADFWVNGYTFFFELAKNIASGKGIGLMATNPLVLFAFPYTLHSLQR